MCDEGVTEPNRPKVIEERDALRVVVHAAQLEGKRIGLVPTMGAFHEGHLSLVRRSVEQCDFTIVTVFVNPMQFGPSEDFANYPRSLSNDLDLLAREGVDLVFTPLVEEIYPEGFSTRVEPPTVSELLEGQCRPGHFRGVATIVLKLFQLVPAGVAYFGQKDYQQLLVIRHMVRDLNVPIKVEACPTVREPDGLAMSSRNRYMNSAQRQRALALSRSLERATEMAAQGERDGARIRAEMRSILVSADVTRIDYIALADPDTLAEVDWVRPGTRALIAAYVGNTRLIDNCQIM